RKGACHFAMLMPAHAIGDQPQAELRIGIVGVFVVLAAQANVRAVSEFNHAAAVVAKRPRSLPQPRGIGGRHSMPRARAWTQAKMRPRSICGVASRRVLGPIDVPGRLALWRRRASSGFP